MSLITIDQLLESVDLDFEPRWVTKDETGVVELWEKKPNKTNYGCWSCYGWQTRLAVLKLSEFADKNWQECIYEVPRKVVISKTETTKPIEKLNLLNDSALLWGKKINELVAAVNKLKENKGE